MLRPKSETALHIFFKDNIISAIIEFTGSGKVKKNMSDNFRPPVSFPDNLKRLGTESSITLKRLITHCCTRMHTVYEI